MKITFIGNCQAQCMSFMADYLHLDVQVEHMPLVYDMANFNTEETRERIYNSDFVFCQRVSDQYAVEFVRPDVIRGALGDRTLIWPNVYFDGYFPGVRYVYTVDGKKLTGPLSDYHFIQIQKMYARGETAQRTFEHLMDYNGHDYLPEDPVGASLQSLRGREQGTDVHISDYIESNFAREKLFHTMNHPSDHTLLVMMGRLLDRAGIKTEIPAYSRELFENFKFSLRSINLPVLPYPVQKYEIPYTRETMVHGFDLVFENGLYGASSVPKSYTGLELVEAYFKVYESARCTDAIFFEGFD